MPKGKSKQGSRIETLGSTVPLSSYGEFRRNGQGDDRRRRVLTDTLGDALDGDSIASRSMPMATRTPPEPKSEHYGDASFMDNLLRVTDLVPRRRTTLAILFLLGAAIIAVLELLHVWAPGCAPYAGPGAAALSLRSPANLSVWVASTMLSLSGLAAILVYNVRRYRNDDYRGRYRIWLWTALCCFLASVDTTAGFHEGFKETMSRVAGTRVYGDGSVWWVAAWLFLFGGVGLRLVVDMRECWLSSGTLIAASLAYGLALAGRFGLPLGAHGVMVEEGAKLTGALLLLMAIATHARHVILDAEGLIHSDGEQEEDEADDDEAYEEIPIVNRGKPARTDLSESKWQAPQAAHPTPQAPAKRPVFTPTPTPAPVAASPAPKPLAGGLGQPPQPHQEKLSKADKKALRKRLLDMRQQRPG